jgi:hypothetical protein
MSDLEKWRMRHGWRSLAKFTGKPLRTLYRHRKGLIAAGVISRPKYVGVGGKRIRTITWWPEKVMDYNFDQKN